MATPKPVRDPATGEVSEPKRGLPTRESLLARGWTELLEAQRQGLRPARRDRQATTQGRNLRRRPAWMMTTLSRLLRAAGQPVTRENWIDYLRRRRARAVDPRG